MYGLFGRLKANSNQREALLNEMLRGTMMMNEVPGCRLYVIATADDDPDSLLIYEAWDTKEDHANSLNHPAVQAVIAAARPYIAGFGERFEFTPVGGLGL